MLLLPCVSLNHLYLCYYLHTLLFQVQCKSATARIREITVISCQKMELQILQPLFNYEEICTCQIFFITLLNILLDTVTRAFNQSIHSKIILTALIFQALSKAMGNKTNEQPKISDHIEFIFQHLQSKTIRNYGLALLNRSKN